MRPLVSVVIPCYEEAANIPPLYERLARVAEGADWELELIFVDDGSRDATPAELEKLVQADPRVRAVRLSRNFGSHMACLAGLSYARGEAVAIMAADLQDPPEVLPQLVEKWREGSDVVWAVRHQRRDSPWRLFFSRAYHRLMQRIALAEMPVEGVDFGLFSARVVQAVLRMQEKNTSLFGLFLWAGYRQTFVRYTKEKRASGRSKWTLGKQVKLLVDSVVSFSFLPIRLISCAGLALAALGLAYAGLIIYVRLFTDLRPETGWPSLIVTVLVLSGFQLTMLGVLGEYLWRALDQIRGRPPYLVQEVLEAPRARPGAGPPPPLPAGAPRTAGSIPPGQPQDEASSGREEQADPDSRTPAGDPLDRG